VDEIYTEADIPVYDKDGKRGVGQIDLKTLKDGRGGLNIKQLLALHYWAACHSLGKNHPYMEVLEQEIIRRVGPEEEKVWSYEEVFNAIVAAGHDPTDVTEKINKIMKDINILESVAAIMVAESLGVHLNGFVLVNIGSEDSQDFGVELHEDCRVDPS